MSRKEFIISALVVFFVAAVAQICLLMFFDGVSAQSDPAVDVEVVDQAELGPCDLEEGNQKTLCEAKELVFWAARILVPVIVIAVIALLAITVYKKAKE